jgi:hypothetical protein
MHSIFSGLLRFARNDVVVIASEAKQSRAMHKTKPCIVYILCLMNFFIT